MRSSSFGRLHKMAPVSIFKDVPLVPTDHVFAVNQKFNEDTHPNKVNMGIGGKFCQSI